MIDPSWDKGWRRAGRPGALLGAVGAVGLLALASCPADNRNQDGSAGAPDAAAGDVWSDSGQAERGDDAGGDAAAADGARTDSTPAGDGSVPADGFGLLPNGQRDKLRWPFAADSIWNMPIGSAAVYEPAGITQNDESGWPTQFVQDQDIIVMTPTAPLTEIFYNGVGWDGGDRCPASGGLLDTLPIPADFVVDNSPENNSAAFLRADGQTVAQNQPFTRCTASAPATALVTFDDEDIAGAGIRGAHGGSNLSALGGTIRLGEFTAGRIHHVMKINVWARQYYHCCEPIWPAPRIDSYADSVTYGGTNPHLGPGALVALAPGFDVAGLRTAPGQILARGLIDYGAYLVDDSYWNGWALATEQGPGGRVVDEFETLFGYPMRPPDGHDFMLDMVAIFEALAIVTNNSITSLGGGGTPRVALAPAIGN